MCPRVHGIRSALGSPAGFYIKPWFYVSVIIKIKIRKPYKRARIKALRHSSTLEAPLLARTTTAIVKLILLSTRTTFYSTHNFRRRGRVLHRSDYYYRWICTPFVLLSLCNCEPSKTILRERWNSFRLYTCPPTGYFIHNFVPAGSTLRNIRPRSVGLTDASFHDSLNPVEYDAVFLI